MGGAAEVVARIERSGLVAIVRLDTGAPLVEVAEAIAAGGIDAIEFTVTTPGALRAVEDTTGRLGSRAFVGVETVLDTETARAALQAGAAAVGVGGRLVDLQAVTDRRFDLLTQRAHELMQAVRLGRKAA